MLGVGGVGHIALQLVRRLGGGSVIAIDTDERRRRLARELGADEVLGEEDDVAAAVRELTGGDGADVVLDFVATDATHAASLAMLARRGLYSLVGYGGLVSVPSVDLVVGETALAGNLVGSWIDLWELLQLHGSGERRAADRDASARRGERGARPAARGRDHRPRRPRAVSLLAGSAGLVTGAASGIGRACVETPLAWGISEERRRQILAPQALKRFGTPEEVAAAVAWLCSEESSFVTAVALPVDAGSVAW